MSRLADHLRHTRNCAAVRTGWRCGASRGRQGACPQRATWEVRRTRVRGVVATLHRCDEHRPAWAEDGTITPFLAKPCDCGLADALAVVPVVTELTRRFAQSGQATSDGKLIVLNKDEWDVLLAVTDG